MSEWWKEKVDEMIKHGYQTEGGVISALFSNPEFLSYYASLSLNRGIEIKITISRYINEQLRGRGFDEKGKI